MGAHFRQDTVLYAHNVVGAADSGQSVRDYDARTTLLRLVQRFLHDLDSRGRDMSENNECCVRNGNRHVMYVWR